MCTSPYREFAPYFHLPDDADADDGSAGADEQDAAEADGAEGGGFCHAQLTRVLAADWPANSTRMVRGHSIPQVPHTYAYFTEGYAIMNEHQVGLAESTCSGRFPAAAGFGFRLGLSKGLARGILRNCN